MTTHSLDDPSEVRTAGYDDLGPGAVAHGAVAFGVAGASRGDELLVTLCGEIDVAARPSVEQFIRLEVEAAPRVLVVDMAAVTFVDSTGLTLLIQAARAVSQGGGKVIVRSPSGQFRRLLAMTGVDQLVDIEPPLPIAECNGVLAGR